MFDLWVAGILRSKTAVYDHLGFVDSAVAIGESKMSFRFCAAVAAIVLPVVASAGPNVLTHQGRLTDVVGVPVEGQTELDIYLYRADSGGAPLWTDEFTVDPDGGYYSLILGQDVANPIADSVFAGDIYLTVSIDNGDESARQLLASVPFAARAGGCRYDHLCLASG